MLSKDAVITRYVFSFCFFFASGIGLLSGIWATLSSILATVELATALLRYSPLLELYDSYKNKKA